MRGVRTSGCRHVGDVEHRHGALLLALAAAVVEGGRLGFGMAGERLHSDDVGARVEQFPESLASIRVQHVGPLSQLRRGPAGFR